MGEFMDLSSSAFPLQLISGVVCTAALGLYALFSLPPTTTTPTEAAVVG